MRRTSTVSGMGQSGHVRVPIPKDIAQALALKAGDVVLWTLEGRCLYGADPRGSLRLNVFLERADERS